jgi:hypothetical protein
MNKFLIIIILFTNQIQLYAGEEFIKIETGAFRKGLNFKTYITKDSLIHIYQFHMADNEHNISEKINLINKYRISKLLRISKQISEDEFKAEGIFDGGYFAIQINDRKIDCINCMSELRVKNESKDEKKRHEQIILIKKIWELYLKISKCSKKFAVNEYCQNPIEEDKYWWKEKKK